MKKFLPFFLLLLSGFSNSQKYVLVDAHMFLPITFTDKVTLQESLKGYFAIEKKDAHTVIMKVEEISKSLADKKNNTQSFNYTIGNTNFTGIKIPLMKDERFDIMLTTDCGMVKSRLHLCDAKIPVNNNVLYMNTWLKYVKGTLK